MKAHFIVKASGNRQRFSPKKLSTSLIKCGLPVAKAHDTSKVISNQVTDQMNTHQVFQLAQQKLLQIDRPTAYRYSLKRGIFELGPTGFPFEKIIGRLFLKQGYEVKNNLMIPGKCITHEIDALAKRENELVWIECKFHNDQGSINDLKTALYIYARYLDLKENELSSKQTKMCFASNTRFSQEAITFSECRQTQLLGWDYPKHQGLKTLLEQHQLYPITVAATLKRKQKVDLIQAGILTTEDFQKNKKKVLSLGIPERKWSELNGDFDLLHNLSL